jgi:hypothetical protein
MKEMTENTRDQVMRVVNDIIYVAHRIRVPSKRVKDLFVDQILKLDELKQYFRIVEEGEQEIEDKGD